MAHSSTGIKSLPKRTYIRLACILLLAILLYVLHFSIVWIIGLVALNSYLSSNKNEALTGGALLGYTIHLAIIIFNDITHHQVKFVGIKLLFSPLLGAIAGVALSGLINVIKRPNVFLILVIGIVACGFPIWITSYEGFTSSKTALLMSVILLAIVAGVTTAVTDLTTKSVFFVTMMAFLVALSIKFYIDLLEDSTSHNLLPFELAYELLIALCFTAVGFGCRRAYKKKYAEDEIL